METLRGSSLRRATGPVELMLEKDAVEAEAEAEAGLRMEVSCEEGTDP
jgi:hypothetical protein